MENKTVVSIETVIDYIEANLDGKLDLETVAEAVHYSKYHLHRMFTSTVGMTIHDYVQRRQYKIPPAEYRDNREFYPLQLRFALHRNVANKVFTKDDICLAEKADIPAWMNLMRLVIDGYPVMDEADYLSKLITAINEKRALVLKDNGVLIGAMAFSSQLGCIDFLGINPQYRKQGIQKLFLDALMDIYLPGQEISMTTYREDDKADTGHRDILKQLGFAERELLIEFGYPTQRFVLPPKYMEDIQE